MKKKKPAPRERRPELVAHRRYGRVTAEKKALVRRMWGNGYPVCEIAVLVDLGYSTVYDIAHDQYDHRLKEPEVED